VEETIENAVGVFGEALGDTGAVLRHWVVAISAEIIPDLREATDRAQREAHAEDLRVMVVHFVAEPCFADLTETVELVERNRIPVGHDEPVENHGEALLAELIDRLDFAEHAGALRNQKLLVVVRIDVRRHHAIDRAGESSVEPVGEDGFDDGALKEPVGFAPGGIEIVVGVCDFAGRLAVAYLCWLDFALEALQSPIAFR